MISDACRWINLWVPLDPPGLEDTCNFSMTDGDLGPLIFVGNIILVIGILAGILLLHIAVVSGVEAYWLWKVSLWTRCFSLYNPTSEQSRLLQFLFNQKSDLRLWDHWATNLRSPVSYPSGLLSRLLRPCFKSVSRFNLGCTGGTDFDSM